MSDLNKIIDDLSKLTVAEAADLSKQLEGNQITAAETVAALSTLTKKIESTRELLELED